LGRVECEKVPDVETGVGKRSGLLDKVRTFDPIGPDVNPSGKSRSPLGNLESEPALMAGDVQAGNPVSTPFEASV